MNNFNAILGLTLAKTIVLLPRPMQYGLGRVLGKVLYRFGKRRRHIAEVNVALCFPELSKQEQEQIKKLVLGEMEYVKSKCDYDFGGFNVTSELSWFDGIPSEHVDNFCNGIYDLIQELH